MNTSLEDLLQELELTIPDFEGLASIGPYDSDSMYEEDAFGEWSDDLDDNYIW